ncbi:hypothetical protein OG226_50670 [Streptomyces sp. NBC_01261]|uniref:MFS transporter n=1 Tax=Streptomyces sp. NBC_01261 TaxID=2903802 RepID=UPI002E33C06D|nr:MFS transporter [Streptomyces sp. NBC_01261]
MRRSARLSVRTVGLLLAVQRAASLMARVGMLRLIRLLTRRRLLFLSMLVAAGGLAALPLADRLLGLCLLMVVIGFRLGLGQPITLGWVAEHVPDGDQGTAMSMRLGGNLLGQTIVPVTVGAVRGRPARGGLPLARCVLGDSGLRRLPLATAGVRAGRSARRSGVMTGWTPKSLT